LPLLNGGRIELLDNPRLISQLCALERRTARGGRDSIDHPPGAHDDVANAIAGVASLLAAGDAPVQSRGFWELMRQRAAALGVPSAQRGGIVTLSEGNFHPKTGVEPPAPRSERCPHGAIPGTCRQCLGRGFRIAIGGFH
jgi:hypothetical protein